MLGIFLDIETNGLDVFAHRPIDIALKIIDLSTGETLAEYQSLIKQNKAIWHKSDLVSLEINGYKWEEIQNGKESTKILNEIVTLFDQFNIVREKAVFICQNPSFDRAFFNYLIPVYTQEEKQWPYHWLDLASMYWAIKIKDVQKEGKKIPKKFNFSKNTIAYHYDIPPEEKPHKAMNGVDHLVQCYRVVVGFDQI